MCLVTRPPSNIHASHGTSSRGGTSRMNAPPKWELFDQEGEKKYVLTLMLWAYCSRVTYIPDEKIANAGTFKILHEDHTMGNMLRMYVLCSHWGQCILGL